MALGDGRWRLMPKQVGGVSLLSQVMPGQYVSHPIASAWYRDRQVAEKAPTGGGYTAARTDWFFAKELLTAIPKPGDVVNYPAFDKAVTVLTVQVALAQTVWQLGTIDLVLAAALSTKVELQTSSLGRDTSLGTTRSWVPKVTLIPARIQLLNEEEAAQRGIEYAEGVCEITVGRQLSVDVREDQIVDAAGQRYAIQRYRWSQRIDELPVVEARIVA